MIAARNAAAVMIAAAVVGLSSARGENPETPRTLRVGAHAQDITPTHLPCFVSGGYFNAKAGKVHHRIYCRSLVIDDGSGPIVLATMDNTGAFRPLFDEVKRLVAGETASRWIGWPSPRPTPIPDRPCARPPAGWIPTRTMSRKCPA